MSTINLCICAGFMFLLVKENVVKGMPYFSYGFKNMKVVALKLNSSLIETLGKGDGKGPHATSEGRVVRCL